MVAPQKDWRELHPNVNFRKSQPQSKNRKQEKKHS
jgi:hypothetical protein